LHTRGGGRLRNDAAFRCKSKDSSHGVWKGKNFSSERVADRPEEIAEEEITESGFGKDQHAIIKTRRKGKALGEALVKCRKGETGAIEDTNAESCLPTS